MKYVFEHRVLAKETIELLNGNTVNVWRQIGERKVCNTVDTATVAIGIVAAMFNMTYQDIVEEFPKGASPKEMFISTVNTLSHLAKNGRIEKPLVEVKMVDDADVLTVTIGWLLGVEVEDMWFDGGIVK